MIRGRDIHGTIVLGITRAELEGITKGKPCFFTNRAEVGGGQIIVLWFGETDEELVEHIKEIFASGPIPIPLDLRTKQGAR